MDKIKSEFGYTITETLVGIIILGITITLFSYFYNQIFSNPKILLRSEALYLASNEIENSVASKAIKDTSYSNERGNLIIKRNIVNLSGLTKAKVTVLVKSDTTSILSLFVFYQE